MATNSTVIRQMIKKHAAHKAKFISTLIEKQLNEINPGFLKEEYSKVEMKKAITQAKKMYPNINFEDVLGDLPES